MLYTRQIIFSFLCTSHFVLLADLTDHNSNQNKPITVEALYAPEISQEMRNAIINELLKQYAQKVNITAPNKKTIVFNEDEIKEMEEVFVSSPKEAQYIIKHLQDPTFFKLIQDYRSTMFVGEPGSGKTTMANAIGHKMIKYGWECKFLSSTSLLGEHRNQTAMHLTKELEAIEASKKPTILIVDELNRLLENTESKHHDTDTTATALWTFIDKQKGNKNFFFIGTMNRINKLPKPYKSRILLNYIKFPPITDSKIKNNFIRKNLTTKSTLSDEVTDAFLDKELEKIGPCVGRDLNNISDAIYKISKITETKPALVLEIKKAAIIHAINQYISNKIELDYDFEEETDEQRQNRYHKENREAQERHFVQQQLIQTVFKDNDYTGESGAYLKSEGKQKIDTILSDEQKKLYQDMMQPTRAREAQEAADKAAIEAAAEQARRAKGWSLPW